MKKFLASLVLFIGVLAALKSVNHDTPQSAFYAVIIILVSAHLFEAIVPNRVTRNLSFVFKAIGRRIGRFLWWLCFGMRRWDGARYLDIFEKYRFFGFKQNRGWLLDGKRLFLPEQAAFDGTVLSAPMGAGKSSGFSVPCILNINHASIVVTDVAGQLYKDTSGYMQSIGYDVRVLNLQDMTRSHGFNALYYARSLSDARQLAQLIISSAPSSNGGDSQFWDAGATKILFILIACLVNRQEPENLNLAKLKDLLTRFDHYHVGEGESELSAWIMESAPETVWRDYLSLIRGEQKTVSSFLMTAEISLNSLVDSNLCKLVSQHDIDFKQFRERKTICYVMIRPSDLKNFSFLLNLFYYQLFKFLMDDENTDGLSVFCMLDEAGNLKIPSLGSYATLARKHRISLFLILQSFSQLQQNFSREESATILNGLRGRIILPGSSIEDAKVISEMLGRKRTRPHPLKRIDRVEENLLNPDEVVCMDDCLYFYGSQRALRFTNTPFYKNRKLLRRSQIPPADLPYLTPQETENA